MPCAGFILSTMVKEKGLTKVHSEIAKRESFLVENSVPACMSRYSRVRDISTCLDLSSEAPSLAKIKAEFTTDTALAYIEMWIVNYLEFVNLKEQMTPNQIKETAILIYQDFYYLNLADITMIFNNAKKGYYGQHYQRIDGVTIISWVTRHAEERANIAEAKAIGEHERANPDLGQRVNEKLKLYGSQKETGRKVAKVHKGGNKRSTR